MRSKLVLLAMVCAAVWPCAAAEVAIAQDGMTLVDGERMFVIGMYEHPKDDAVLQAVANAGVNLVRARSKEQLDRLDAHGIYAWVNTGYSIDLGPEGEKTAEKLRTMVDAHGDHPALLVWEVPDEALWGCWLKAWREGGSLVERHARYEARRDALAAGIRHGYETLKSLDPHHPVWMNHAPCNGFEDLALFGQAADIMGCDIYPVCQPPGIPWDITRLRLAAVGEFTELNDRAAPGKPTWTVLQGFGWGDLGSGPMVFSVEGSRRPTAHELRCMTFDAIIRGARGVLFWGTHYLEKDSRLWHDVLAQCRELSELQHVLAAPDYAGKVAVESRLFLWPMEGSVHALGKQTEDGVWWLVVNETPLPLRYTLTAGAYRIARPIEPHGVHIIPPEPHDKY